MDQKRRRVRDRKVRCNFNWLLLLSWVICRLRRFLSL